ncbi:MAG: efflux RND transporter periplasmic adaptor subunit [Burkholderiales bacterium]|nr:efflux RND transporter periplasmic adaptor subunit [Burkholderiales bacterium]MCW5881057.1 efflux RND transporter periplasmic adaptor subunit [Anaerolineae bacterium]
MSTDREEPPRRRTLLKLGAAAAGIAALGGGTWYAWKTWGGGRNDGQSYISAAVLRGDIEDLVAATGSLQPLDYVDVGAQVSGQLRKLYIEVGSEVQEGDLLAEIDAETSTARVDASRAQLRSQQAQLTEREVNLAKAERDLQRQKNLMIEEATTAEAMQNAETAVQTARAQINSLKAQMEQLQASTRVDEANLKFTRIYAPLTGTVVSITARQGQTLNANQSAPTLMRVADLSTMTVQTQVSEADVSRLAVDMPVYFTTLGGQGRRWHGQLRKIEPTPTVTNNVVLYNALFDVPNANRSLMTQMTVQVFFVVAEARDVLTVPMSALTLQRGRGNRARADKAGSGQDAGTAAAGETKPPAVAPLPPDSQAAPAGHPVQATGRATKDREKEKPRSHEASPRRSPDERQRQPAQTSESGRPAAEGGRPRFNREAFQKMSPEERQRLRERMQAERRASAKTPLSPRSGKPDINARNSMSQGTRSAPAATEVAARPPRPPRKATVKVIADNGSVQEREVTVGISNRIHAEILSGLAEGERVVAGIRQPARPSTPPQQQRNLGPMGFGTPGGMPKGR